MKKLIYSLALVLMGLTSCTSFDDPVTENYGAGPAVDVNVTAANPTDSAFVVTITPAAGTLYYAYLIEPADEAQKLDGYTLLKGGYSNTVVKASDQAVTTINIDEADPNTTYQVYAVAANDKGIVGDVVVKSIKTTDALIPGDVGVKRDGANKAVVLTFHEAVTRGEGAVKAVYYKEWDILNPVELAADEFVVETNGNTVSFSAPEAPAGSYVCFSYEAGAFKDAAGNSCAALNSGLNMETGRFTGAYVHVDNVPFEVDDSCVTAPEDGALIAAAEDFVGKITFPFDVYRNDETVEAGDVCINLSNDSREATYKLSADQWSVEGNVLTFVLPVTPMGGDNITVSLVEGAVTDVYGNPNAAFTSETSWLFFAPTLDMILGMFDFGYYSSYDEEPQLYNGGPVTISENPEKEGGLIIKGLFSDLVEGAELEGSFDLASGKLFIDAYQVLGTYTNSKGTTYGLVLYSLTNEDLIEFTINADGTITSTDLGIVAYDETYENPLGWFEKASIAALSPKTDAAARSMKTWKQTGSKAKKVAARARNLKKHVRK